MQVKTIEVEDGNGGKMVINASDFNPEIHKEKGAKAPAKAPAKKPPGRPKKGAA